ncbi:hypothetical protein K6W55_11995 [Burkholderia dolosa]|nr:hypothetical protein [Burkholderia dolosa]
MYLSDLTDPLIERAAFQDRIMLGIPQTFALFRLFDFEFGPLVEKTLLRFRHYLRVNRAGRDELLHALGYVRPLPRALA